MYVRRGISVWPLFRDSWPFLFLVILWSVLVVYLHEIRGFFFIAIPMAPITIIGIAVSLYLGFKSTSAYNRWWEARILWGQVVAGSRSWALQALHLVYAGDEEPDPAVPRELIERHLAWVNALAHELRSSTRLEESRVTRFFDHRRVLVDADFHQQPECGATCRKTKRKGSPGCPTRRCKSCVVRAAGCAILRVTGSSTATAT